MNLMEASSFAYDSLNANKMRAGLTINGGGCNFIHLFLMRGPAVSPWSG